MKAIVRFLKDWTLPVSMLTGIIAYFTYTSIPCLDSTHAFANRATAIIQPILIFSMLFLTFCKVNPSDLKFKKWMIWLLLLQVGSFSLLSYVVYLLPPSNWNVVIEGGMLCMICPTATAAAVITQKLGGNAGTLSTYTILINLAVAISIPLLVPLFEPKEGFSFMHSFLLISSRVFPLLFGPFLLAMALRWISREATNWFAHKSYIAFYLWAIGLAIAIAVTTKSIMHSKCPIKYEVGIALASLVACIIQFAFGRYMGKRYNDIVSSAQGCGQKNTMFAIWLGYTFMNPVTSIAGGFYSIWHNVYNSYQLYQQRKKESEK